MVQGALAYLFAICGCRRLCRRRRCLQKDIFDSHVFWIGMLEHILYPIIPDIQECLSTCSSISSFYCISIMDNLLVTYVKSVPFMIQI